MFSGSLWCLGHNHKCFEPSGDLWDMKMKCLCMFQLNYRIDIELAYHVYSVTSGFFSRFLMRFTKDESEINLANGAADPEFAEWKCASPEEVIEQAVDYKRPTYEEVIRTFQSYFDGSALSTKCKSTKWFFAWGLCYPIKLGVLFGSGKKGAKLGLFVGRLGKKNLIIEPAQSW
ncbi:unnamed protein product [Prunus armeniaca]|uniref:Uncharacterized protein n=1 Tax=Prunus armeniaca TaxID=36596 RepID=A0A6J5XUA1_PRUAR|nr:unnamed protein product [Prunus armeniaca]CAB4314766.1 unnamed protein product [Prunus armeniaca]